MKKFLLIVITLFIIVQVMAQKEPIFSIQFNSGYTWASGVKINKLISEQSPPKYSLGTFTNGFIPIEVELRAKAGKYFAFDLAYGYNLSLLYKSKIESSSVSFDFSTSVPSHSARLGGILYFTNTFVKPYLGLDILVLFSQIKGDAALNTALAASKFTTKNFVNVGIMPKLGIEFNLGTHVFLNAEVHYDLTIPTEDIKITANEIVYPKSSQSVNHGIGARAGIGFKF